MNLLHRLRLLFGIEPRTTGAPISYSLPAPSLHNKLFNRDQRFSSHDWSDWPSVVDGFQKRFQLWYFCHMPGGHASYVDLCAMCALIDTFTYYTSDRDWHDQRHYKEFLRKLDSQFRQRLITPIKVTRHRNNSWQLGTLKDVADVFYAGVRCSLHHHGDLASYAGMKGTGTLITQYPNAGQSNCGRHSYTLVIFDPGELKRTLHLWFDNFCRDLRDNPQSEKADRFRSKFMSDFGVTVSVPPAGP